MLFQRAGPREDRCSGPSARSREQAVGDWRHAEVVFDRQSAPRADDHPDRTRKVSPRLPPTSNLREERFSCPIMYCNVMYIVRSVHVLSTSLFVRDVAWVWAIARPVGYLLCHTHSQEVPRTIPCIGSSHAPLIFGRYDSCIKGAEIFFGWFLECCLPRVLFFSSVVTDCDLFHS